MSDGLTAAHDGPPMRGSRLSRALGRAALRLAGWRIEGVVPRLPRFVVIVAPHTSNWDFLVGVAAMFALGLRVHFLGKHTLFRGPLGPVMRWLGGEPVDRAAPDGVVEGVVARIAASRRYLLALSPEGTRRRIARWRTGFHRIASAAGIPIVPVWLDWSRRVVGIGEPMMPTADRDADIVALRAHYRSEMGRFPERYAEHEPPGALAGEARDAGP